MAAYSSFVPLPSQQAAIAVAATGAVIGTCLAWANRGLLTHLVYKSIARMGMSKHGVNYLQGNFAPVHGELGPLGDLKVESGEIPVDLNGVFVRTGPNPMFTPLGGYHWFDGDGMLHAVRLQGGKATYCNRYVDTARLKQEKARGEAVLLKLGDLVGGQGIMLGTLDGWRKYFGFTDLSQGAGTANTALVYHARRLLALHEGDLPYAIKLLCNGAIETLGRLSTIQSPGEEWKGAQFTAHPKVCGATGELLFFGYSFEKPYLRAGIMDTEGVLTRSWDVDLPYPTMMHDMAATRKYIVLLHLPLTFDPAAMGQGKMPFQFHKDKPARIGLLRRDQPSTAPGGFASVQWFEFPAFFVFHVANAFEDPATGKVRIFACHFEEFHFETMMDDEGKPPGQRQRMQEYTLDPAAGTATMHEVSSVFGDFPVIHPNLHCLPNRFTWVAMLGAVKPKGVNFTGLGKVDLQTPQGKDALVASIQLPPGCQGGKAVFVPRHAGAPKPGEEDDGWLLLYVWHPTQSGSTHGSGANGATVNGSGTGAKGEEHAEEGTSKLHIYDAKSMGAAPLAVVALPRRVPFGFHGTFVTQEQVKAQLPWL